MSRAVSPLTICRTFMDSGIRGSKNRTSPFTLPTHEFHNVRLYPDQTPQPRTSRRTPACELTAAIRQLGQRSLAFSVSTAEFPLMSLRFGTVRNAQRAVQTALPLPSGLIRYCFYQLQLVAESKCLRCFVTLNTPSCTSDPDSFSFSQQEIALGSSNQTGAAGTIH